MNHPNLEPCKFKGGGSGYFLEEPWSYTWHVGELERQLRLPAGFCTDGASVPRMLWWFMPPDGLWRAASVCHDALYRWRGLIPHETLFERPIGAQGWIEVPIRKRGYQRITADKMFARLCGEGGVSVVQRRSAYRVLRLFGWAAWMGEPEKLVREDPPEPPVLAA